jgi:hypothetical protein
VQQLTDAPRDTLTATQVEHLLRDAQLTLAGGLELVDQDLNVLEDLSDDLRGGSVSRNSYADLHATATLRLARRLQWGSAIVRPYIILAEGALSARFNLGAFYTSTPATDFTEFPITFEVAGYDVLHRLNQRVGDAFSVQAGRDYLGAVEEILAGRGYTAYVIDRASSAKVLPTSRTWALDPNITWLSIVNDLLGAIGYQGVWSDWDGRLRCQPYTRPVDRAVEWLYDADQIGTRRSIEYDFFAVPNRWVVWRGTDTDGPPPVEGNGVYTYQNEAVGDTSVTARDGLVITRMEQVDAADQESLQTQAQAMIDADMAVPTRVAIETAANPMHWHFDHVLLDEPTMGPPMDALCTAWSLPLPPDGGLMTHEWTVLG